MNVALSYINYKLCHARMRWRVRERRNEKKHVLVCEFDPCVSLCMGVYIYILVCPRLHYSYVRLLLLCHSVVYWRENELKLNL